MSPELVLEKPYDHTADLWFVAGFSSFRCHILLNCSSFDQNTIEVVVVVRNIDIKNQLNIKPDIVDRICSGWLRYFEHVVRMQSLQIPYQALYGHIHGNRPRRRLQKHWVDNISDDCQMLGQFLTLATSEAEARSRWMR